jgi:hypothetical protein
MGVSSSPAAPPLAEKLPRQTVLYFGWAGRNEAYNASKMGRMFDDPAVRRAIAKAQEAMLEDIPVPPRDLARQQWALMGALLEHPVAFGLVGRDAGGALVADLGDEKKAFEAKLLSFAQSLGLPLVDAKVGQTQYLTLGLPESDVGFGFQGNLFFFAAGKGMVRRVVLMKGEDSLKADRRFTESFLLAGGKDIQGAVYVDFTRLLPGKKGQEGEVEVTDPGLRAIVEFLRDMGLDRADRLAVGVRIVDGGMYTRMVLRSPAPHSGLLKSLAGRPLTEADLADIPADALYAAAANVSMAGIAAQLDRHEAYMKPHGLKSTRGLLAEFGQATGLSLGRDVVAHLGGRWVMSAAPAHDDPIGAVLTGDVTDAGKLLAAEAAVIAKLRQALAPAGEKAGPALRTTTVGERKMHHVTGLSKDARFPFSPAWCLSGRKLHLATSPGVIRRALEEQAGPGLLQSEAFRAARKRIVGRPSLLAYVDYPRLLAHLRRHRELLPVKVPSTLLNLSALLGYVDWARLPPVEKYLAPSIVAVSSDPGTFLLEAYGSLPTTGLEAAPIGVVAGAPVALPAIDRARIAAMKAVAATRLKGFANALVMYQAEHDDKFPARLEALVEEGHLGPGQFVTPASGRRPPKLVDGKFVGETDFVYLKAPVKSMDSLDGGYVVMYERPENYLNKGTFVLYMSFSVRWLSMEEFREALKRNEEYVRSAQAAETDDS